MCDKLEEVRKDIAELELLLSQATRPKVKDILSLEIRKLTPQMSFLEDAAKKPFPMEAEPIVSPTNSNKCYDVKLNNYGWDQSQKYLKLYVTIQNVKAASAENVYCTFTNKSVELYVKELDNKNYYFTVKNLLYNINPNKSSWKLKTDTVAILLAKEVEENWSHVTELEKKASDHKKLVPDKMDESKDPGENLINMMRKMYETGDDEMKRTIAKAWTEGANKKNNFDL